MLCDACHVIANAIEHINHRKPAHLMSMVRAIAAARVGPYAINHLRRFQAFGQKVRHFIIRERAHGAFCVLNHKPLQCAHQLMRYDQRTDCVIACPPACVANDMSVTFNDAGKLRRVEPMIHASENCGIFRRLGWQFVAVGELSKMALIGCQYRLLRTVHEVKIFLRLHVRSMNEWHSICQSHRSKLPSDLARTFCYNSILEQNQFAQSY